MNISIKIETDGFPCSVCKKRISSRRIKFTNEHNKILYSVWLCTECMRETAQKFQPYT